MCESIKKVVSILILKLEFRFTSKLEENIYFQVSHIAFVSSKFRWMKLLRLKTISSFVLKLLKFTGLIIVNQDFFFNLNLVVFLSLRKSFASENHMQVFFSFLLYRE